MNEQFALMSAEGEMTHGAFDRPQGSGAVGRQLLCEPYPYFHSVLASLVFFADSASVFLISGVSASLEHRFTAVRSLSLLSVADMASALVFVLCPKKRALLAFPKLCKPINQFRYLWLSVLAATFMHILVMVGMKTGFPDTLAASGLWLALIGCTLLVERGIATAMLALPSIQMKLRRNIAILGHGDVATGLAERIVHDAGSAYNLMGFFDCTPDIIRPGADLPAIDDLLERSRRQGLHAVIIALPPSGDREWNLRSLSESLRWVPSDIYAVPHMLHGADAALPVEQLGPYALFVLQRRPLTEMQNFQKRVFDLIFSVIVTVFLSPLMLLVAAAIKIESPGPVFFRQPRRGLNGRMFSVFKFRSMRNDAADLGAARQTSRDDPRVTRVGKWIRRLSIDELPQLLNVLSGDMSLVGPRPHAPKTRAGGFLLHEALADYMLRYHVKPGITGWAQVNGARGELVTQGDLERRVQYDLDYIRRWSMFFDIRIMVLTVYREIFSRHAY